METLLAEMGDKTFQGKQTNTREPCSGAALHKARARPQSRSMLFRASSSIRTLTVGPGISPDLLTLACRRMRSARGLTGANTLPVYRRWGISPRPEDVL